MRELLRIRDFRLLWTGQAVSNFGDGVTNLAHPHFLLLGILAPALPHQRTNLTGTGIALRFQRFHLR